VLFERLSLEHQEDAPNYDVPADGRRFLTLPRKNVHERRAAWPD
jgi:hypothetical protein